MLLDSRGWSHIGTEKIKRFDCGVKQDVDSVSRRKLFALIYN